MLVKWDNKGILRYAMTPHISFYKEYVKGLL